MKKSQINAFKLISIFILFYSNSSTNEKHCKTTSACFLDKYTHRYHHQLIIITTNHHHRAVAMLSPVPMQVVNVVIFGSLETTFCGLYFSLTNQSLYHLTHHFIIKYWTTNLSPKPPLQNPRRNVQLFILFSIAIIEEERSKKSEKRIPQEKTSNDSNDFSTRKLRRLRHRDI